MKYRRYPYFFLIGMFVLLVATCRNPSPKEQPVTTSHTVIDREPDPMITALDVDQDIEHLDIQELRILRSFVYARYGMLFTESDLRNYWKENTVWYDTLSHSQYNKGFTDIPSLPENEQIFVNRIDNRISLLRQMNYVRTNYDTIANILNIVNMFQYAEITQQEIMDELAVNHYAIATDTLPQLFQVYQRNDTLHIPNFVTTDLLLQLSYIYEAYVLKTIEEGHFVPMLTNVCLSMYQAAMEQANKATKEEMKDMAEYNAAFFAVPYCLLTGKSLKLPATYQTQVEEELAYIDQQEDHRPVLLNLDTYFSYSAFKPYGHYTQTSELRRYFKALKWLQLAPYCREDKTQLRQVIFAATILHSAKTKSGEAVIDMYRRLYESMAWFSGQPAYASILDVAVFLKKERISKIDAALDDKILAIVDAMLKKMQTNDDIAIKNATSCQDGIYVLPPSIRIDEKILQTMVDYAKNAERAFPKALDVFAAFGSQPAFDKLFNDYQEDTIWGAFPEKLAKAKDDMQRFKDWNGSSYNKRMECLLTLQQKSRPVPLFMQKQAWNTKTLTTSSAAWIKLKQDMLCYGVIPEYPEPINTKAILFDSLPAPLTVGYVEPNLLFWKKLLEWVEMTGKTLNKHQLMNDSLRTRTIRLYRYVTTMSKAAEKELKGEKLEDETYRFIAHIGDSIQQFTLSMVEPHVDRWAWVAGSDKSVAILDEIYHRNVPNDPKNGTLYATTGNANNIYVVVDIDGYLYLTKGAVFNYYEFSMSKGKRFTEKDWQEMLIYLNTD